MPKVDRANDPKAGLPVYAKCYCVTRHMPVYFRPFEWALPDGRAIYLCPATYRAAKTLLAIHEKLGQPPALKVQAQFTLLVRRLVELHWRLKLAGDVEYQTKHEYNDKVVSLRAAEEEIVALWTELQTKGDAEWERE